MLWYALLRYVMTSCWRLSCGLVLERDSLGKVWNKGDQVFSTGSYVASFLLALFLCNLRCVVTTCRPRLSLSFPFLPRTLDIGESGTSI